MKHAAKDSWPTQDAKTHLTKLIRRAQKVGPQIITRHGKPQVKVVAVEVERKPTAAAKPKPDLVDWLLRGPKLDDETIAFINHRPRDYGRDTSHLFDE